jgi:aminobenzoyl-glutamate utilization protein B
MYTPKKIVYLFLIMVMIFIPCVAYPGPAMQEGKETVIKWADENAAHITEISRKIWEYAEIGLKEFKTSDLLVSELEANGFKVERGLAGMPTSFVGTFTRGTGKPVIGFLAEYDALPNGHSCGHNLFGSGSLGAAIAVKKAMEKHNLNGTIKFFGTPTEDTHGGKVWMARDGVFNGCDAILSWHPGFENKVDYGSNLAVQILDIDFRGRSAHTGRAPEQGRSALDALMIGSMAMEFLREHMIEPMRIQYIVTNGGQAVNVVPDYTQMKLAFRGPTMKDIDYLRTREGGSDDCLRAGALGSGTDVFLRVVGGFFNRLPNKAGADLMLENMKAVNPPTFTAEEEDFVKSLAKKYNLPLGKLDRSIKEPEFEILKASADTGDVSYIAPLIGMTATCSAVGTPGHHLTNMEQYGMSIGWKGMIYAVKVMGSTAIDLLTDEGKLAAIKAEFKEKTKDSEYRAVIPPDLWPPIPEKNPADFKGPAPQVFPKPKPPESLLFWKKK